jgi:hypothetical protein
MRANRGKQLSKDAFISIMAGYHSFYPKGVNNRPLLDKYETAAAYSSKEQGVTLYKYGTEESNQERKGLFVGNRVYYKYLPKTGLITSKLDKQIRSQGVANGSEILRNFIPDLTARMEQGVQRKLKVDKVPSPSEQMSSIGGKAQKAGSGVKGAAQPVDVSMGKEHYQITFSKLSDLGQHGVYGKAGRRLREDIRKLEAQYGSSDKKNKKTLQKIADKGLRYFQNRLKVWNSQMAHIQKLTGATTGKELRVDMDDIAKYGVNFNRGRYGNYGFQVNQGFKNMAGKPTGYFNKNAGNITRTALGNMAEFGTGVTYTFQLSQYNYAHISKFKMLTKPNFHFDRAALNKALVVEGHTELSGLLAIDSANLDEQAVAMNQFHSQIAYETSKTNNLTETMSEQTQATSTLLSGSTRVYPSIDLVHADKDFSKYIRDEVVPTIEDEFKKASRGNVGKNLGSRKSIHIDGKTFWALPYLSIADYDIRRHGI